MKRPVISAVALVSLMTLPMPVAAEDLASSIVGVWQYATFTSKEVVSGKTTTPYGEKPSGYIVYTRGGRVVFALIGDNRKAPAGPVPTDAERVALYNTLAAGSGAYKVEGNNVTVTFDTSWNHVWTGTSQTRQVEVVGNKLTVTSPPVKSITTGLDIVFTITYDRVE